MAGAAKLACVSLWLASLSILVAAPSAAAVGASTVGRQSATWCGRSSLDDRVCRWRGTVFSDDELLPRRVPAPLGETLATGPRSEARLSFAGEADCTLGESSQIYPGDGAPDSLYSQQYGSSSCSSPDGPGAVRLLCGPTEPCPAEVRVRGTVLLAFPLPGAASASSLEARSRRVRIVVCAGSVRVTTNEGGEAGGGTNGENRYVIVVEEKSSHTVEEGLEESGSSTAIRVVGTLAGPGGCAAPTIEAEESTSYGF